MRSNHVRRPIGCGPRFPSPRNPTPQGPGFPLQRPIPLIAHLVVLGFVAGATLGATALAAATQPPAKATPQAAEEKKSTISEGGRVTLRGKGLTLTDVVAAIQKQTGNDLVDLREEYGQEVTNAEVDVDWKDVPFWQALDELSAKAKIGYELDTGDRRAIGIVGLEGPPATAGPRIYAGAFRLAVERIVRQRLFDAPEATCTVQFEVAWEPRLRPILLEQLPAELTIVDENGSRFEIEADPMPETATPGIRASVDSSIMRTDFVVNLKKPPKGATTIRSFKGTLNALVPADIQTHRFRDIAKSKSIESKKGDIVVTFGGIADEDGVWKADVELAFAGAAQAFESYETWYEDNEVYLERADGTRFAQNGGLNLLETGEGSVSIQYIFVDAPGKLSDYSLVYKTPSRIARVAVPYEFKDLELP